MSVVEMHRLMNAAFAVVMAVVVVEMTSQMAVNFLILKQLDIYI